MNKAEEQEFKLDFAERFRLAIRGDTQAHVSKKIGISQGNIAKYLQGQIIPRSDVIKAMKDQYGIAPDWLLSGEGRQYLKKMKPGKKKKSGKDVVPLGYKDEKCLEEIDFILRCHEKKKRGLILATKNLIKGLVRF